MFVVSYFIFRLSPLSINVLASLILCLESVFAVLGGALILGEVLNAREIVGCVLMISAFIIANTKVEQRY